MDEQKLEFCLKLGRAIPASQEILNQLESLLYIKKFPRIDIENKRQVNIYCVLIPFSFRIHDSPFRLVAGHTFHTFDDSLILPIDGETRNLTYPLTT